MPAVIGIDLLISPSQQNPLKSLGCGMEISQRRLIAVLYRKLIISVTKSVHITIRTLRVLRTPVYRGCNVGECLKVSVVRFRLHVVM